MSQYDSEICVLLVNDAYGELTSRIYEGLLRHGRSTIPAIQYVTRLTLRQVNHGLSVLVQQHLVFWRASSVDELGTFEANLPAAYNLLRTGKYVHLTENRLGEFAGAVISHLLLLGHARVSDLMQAYGISYMKDIIGRLPAKRGLPSKTALKESSLSGQINGSESVSREKINQTLCELLQAGLIGLVHESDFRSEADNRAEVEKTVPLVADYKAKNKKEKEAMREEEIKEKLGEWRFGTKEERREIENFKMGRKRALEDPDESQEEKRQRHYLTMSREYIATTGSLEPKLTYDNLLKNDLVVRINHDRFAVMMRNDSLVSLAQKTISNITAQVYEKTLRRLEPRLLACRGDDEEDDEEEEVDRSMLPSISTEELVAAFDETTTLTEALGKVELEMIKDASDHPKKRRRKSNGNDDEDNDERDASADESDYAESSGDDSDNISVVEMDSDQDVAEEEYRANGAHINPAFAPNLRHQAVRQHLLLLAQHPHRFLYHIRSMPGRPERWAVHFRALSRTAALQTIFHTIQARHGIASTRLARICQERGRMDDKSLQTLSLLTQKEMRARLLQMQKGGLLELQEVPRDNARVASRTSFLYFMDEGKVKAKLTDECFKTMSNCLKRLAVEREMVAGVLEKVERSDVKGREEELLGAKEKEALGRWNAQEAMIWGEVARVDEVVGVLRDF